MNAYVIVIISVTLFVCLVNALTVAMMAFYSSDRHWDEKKFYLWKIISYVVYAMCLIWIPTIWIVYAFCH